MYLISSSAIFSLNKEHLLGKAASLAAATAAQPEISKARFQLKVFIYHNDYREVMKSQNDTSLQCEETSNLPSFLNTATPASQNEAWARLNNDPLLMVSHISEDDCWSMCDSSHRFIRYVYNISPPSIYPRGVVARRVSDQEATGGSAQDDP